MSRGPTLRDAVWSASVQHGQAYSIIRAAVKQLTGKDGDVSTVSDGDLIRAIYEERDRRHPAYRTRYLRELYKAMDALEAESS